MGRSRTAPVLVSGVAMIAGALLIVAIPGLTARSGALSSVATPNSRVDRPRSAALRTPAPSSSPVPTTNVTRGPDKRQADPTVASPSTSAPTEWPPKRIEPPTSPDSLPRNALPQLPESTGVWGPPKSTGPPSPGPQSDWSIAPARAGNGVASAGAAAGRGDRATAGSSVTGAAGRTAANQAVAVGRPAQAAAPAAAPGTPDAGSDGYLVVGAVLLLAGGGLIVLARGIEATRPRRRRRHGAHRHLA